MNKKIISIILILILLSLNIATFVVNKKFNCDNCEIRFKQDKMYGMQLNKTIIYVYHPRELLDSILNNTCIITWERNGGFHANKLPENY
jgi:hypothetical protein